MDSTDKEDSIYSINNTQDKAEPDTKILPKKRGRPRKNKILDKVPNIIDIKKKININNENRELILHLPIFGKEEHTKKNINSDIISDNMSENVSDIINTSNMDKNEDTQDNIFTLSEQNNSEESELSNDLICELKAKNKLIKSLRDENNELKRLIQDTSATMYKEIKTVPMNVSFVSIENGQQIICENTDIACWWCTYQFNSFPCFIPDKYINNTFYVFGCFCSFNCASAYNMNLADYKVSERNSILRKLYAIIYGNYSEIPLAPSREVLKKYGGPISIEEYRQLFSNITKEYKLLLPSMLNQNVYIEEKIIDKNNLDKNNKLSIPEINQTHDSKNIIPVKKKLIHNSTSFNIIDTIGIREKNSHKFNV
jgi:hypothetical protein